MLALFQDEPVTIDLPAALARATISAVNLCEVVTKLIEAGQSRGAARQLVETLNMPVVAFDAEMAFDSAALRPLTRDAGLSLGDRCCLALATRLGLTALTADRPWSAVIGVVECDILLIR